MKNSSHAPCRTLGPVADLEKHLPADWWRTLFNAVYLKTDGDVSENDVNTIREVDMLLAAAGLTTESRVLDLCCGQGRHSIELASRGFLTVCGVDRSRYLIRVAKRRASQKKLAIRFSEGDARRLRFKESSFDCVTMFGNSFGYFESQEDDVAVLTAVSKVLVSAGVFVLDVLDGCWMREQFEPRSWEWIDENHFVCRERSLSADQTRIISREVVTHAERGVIADQFYAERLYNFDEIREMLMSLGFSNVTQHKNISPTSARNQDLGMMANRLFISAIAPTKHKPKVVISSRKKIMVLMGDPRKPDKVKLNGQFNAEDFETIEKLKVVLQDLPYTISYDDDHQKLLDTLTKNKPDFVLNLCDEGFGNDASMELHVPALLEMLNIPYSGAGPDCLALCYNKAIVRAVAAGLDIAVPLETYVNPSDQMATLPSIFPAMIKPNCGDSSIGITQDAVVHDKESLIAYLDTLKMTLPGIPILIQEFLSGDEYSVGVIGNPDNYTVLPILKVNYAGLPAYLPKILGYESKWDPATAYWDSIRYEQAELKIEEERQLVDAALVLFERLGCRDYARFDFRADEQGVMKLLEVNPNPGWCWDGKLNLMAGFAGKSYADLLTLIMDAAMERVGMPSG
ncbi:MAG: D-alanine--D-alanine ligase [marine bacterium B5-7]|nr:MAG: D-alanine--D-alanine ligase [marine bacterium B5-7]